MLGRMDGQHRTRCLANNLLGDTAQQHMHEASSAMSADHDEIDFVLSGVSDDLYERVPLKRCSGDVQC